MCDLMKAVGELAHLIQTDDLALHTRALESANGDEGNCGQIHV